MSARARSVGPFARLRPGARARRGRAHRQFRRGEGGGDRGRRQGQSPDYIGDARVGAGANIGAGTITCNYDGAAKHRTDIGKGAFIGSNSALVAPVKIGDGAYVGSGSVITERRAGRMRWRSAAAGRSLRKAGPSACVSSKPWARAAGASSSVGPPPVAKARLPSGVPIQPCQAVYQTCDVNASLSHPDIRFDRPNAAAAV